jgi:hypothetical protein
MFMTHTLTTLDNPYSLFHILDAPTHRWINLENLQLISAFIEMAEMEQIMKTTRGKLHTLQMCNVHLQCGTWREVLDMWRGKVQYTITLSLYGAERVSMSEEQSRALFDREFDAEGQSVRHNVVDKYLMRNMSVNPFNIDEEMEAA